LVTGLRDASDAAELSRASVRVGATDAVRVVAPSATESVAESVTCLAGASVRSVAPTRAPTGVTDSVSTASVRRG